MAGGCSSSRGRGWSNAQRASQAPAQQGGGWLRPQQPDALLAPATLLLLPAQVVDDVKQISALVPSSSKAKPARRIDVAGVHEGFGVTPAQVRVLAPAARTRLCNQVEATQMRSTHTGAVFQGAGR